jgi:RNA polymerase sigma-B factor
VARHRSTLDRSTSSSTHLPERRDRATCTDEVLARLDDATSETEREMLIEELIRINMPVARSIAVRYRRRGIAEEDLEQVAYLALVRVAHSYDHSSGHDFLSYAVPSIRGEVRRHFRDVGWMVRPPRRVQELQSRIAAAESELSSELGHPPTAAELADRLGATLDDVEEALAANGCFTPTSLDQVVHDDGTGSLGDRLGADEPGLAAAEARVVLAPALRRLGERDRLIVRMRFFGQRTQQEIADEIGVTQMQVSRLISRICKDLRETVESQGVAGGAHTNGGGRRA